MYMSSDSLSARGQSKITLFAMMNACPVCHVNEAHVQTPYCLWITGLLVLWPAVAKLVATSRDNLFNNAFESFPFFFFSIVSVLTSKGIIIKLQYLNDYVVTKALHLQLGRICKLAWSLVRHCITRCRYGDVCGHARTWLKLSNAGIILNIVDVCTTKHYSGVECTGFSPN